MDWMSHESSLNISRSYILLWTRSIYHSTPSPLPTPMPRHDAKRGVSTSVALLTPATLLKTRDGQCSCMAGSTFPMRARQRLTASYLTRPWSLRLELTSWAGS